MDYDKAGHIWLQTMCVKYLEAHPFSVSGFILVIFVQPSFFSPMKTCLREHVIKAGGEDYAPNFLEKREIFLNKDMWKSMNDIKLSHTLICPLSIKIKLFLSTRKGKRALSPLVWLSWWWHVNLCGCSFAYKLVFTQFCIALFVAQLFVPLHLFHMFA